MKQFLALLGLIALCSGGRVRQPLVERDLVLTEEMQLQLSEGFYETVAEIQKQLAGYTYEIVSSG